ncbi:MAG: hypothetical protein ABT05_07665 [Lautropia sp. SCN 66-9]|nr:MAG: hypothetical protein ABT05_07665 [Lautropia sp. SCN 66-9]
MPSSRASRTIDSSSIDSRCASRTAQSITAARDSSAEPSALRGRRPARRGAAGADDIGGEASSNRAMAQG